MRTPRKFNMVVEVEAELTDEEWGKLQAWAQRPALDDALEMGEIISGWVEFGAEIHKPEINVVSLRVSDGS